MWDVYVGWHLRAPKLQEILSHAAKTPALFLDLMFDARVASDIECLYFFSQRNWTDTDESEAEMETLQCLALRKAPPRLIDVARERYQREVWGVSASRRKPPGFPRDANRLWDMKVLQYILQADPQGVNDTDEAWCLNDLNSDEGFLDHFPWYYHHYIDDNERICFKNCTALHYAAALRNPWQSELCNLILDHPEFSQAGATASWFSLDSEVREMNFGGRDGWNALHVALEGESFQNFWLGRTRRDIEKQKKYSGESFLKHPKCMALWNQENAHGMTPLRSAVLHRHLDILEYLVDVGIDPAAFTRQCDPDGRTILDFILQQMEEDEGTWLQKIHWKMLEILSPTLDNLSRKKLLENRGDKSKREAVKLFQSQGKMMAGAHLGKGKIDIEVLCGTSFTLEENAKMHRAQQRYLKQMKRDQRERKVTGFSTRRCARQDVRSTAVSEEWCFSPRKTRR